MRKQISVLLFLEMMSILFSSTTCWFVSLLFNYYCEQHYIFIFENPTTGLAEVKPRRCCVATIHSNSLCLIGFPRHGLTAWFFQSTSHSPGDWLLYLHFLEPKGEEDGEKRTDGGGGGGRMELAQGKNQVQRWTGDFSQELITTPLQLLFCPHSLQQD